MTGLTNPWQPVISIMRYSLFIVLPIRDGMLLSISPDSSTRAVCLPKY